MSLESRKIYPYPDSIENTDDIKEYLRRLYIALTEAGEDFTEDLEYHLNDYWAFKTITGITNDVVADQKADTLTLAGDGTVTITGTAATDTITWTWGHLGFEDLSDPGADKIVFWDDGEGALKWLTPNDFISIDGTNLDVPVKDEDDMSSDSETHLATQQSIKAYVDSMGAGSAPVDAEYVVVSGDATLTDERTLGVSTGLGLTDGGADGVISLYLQHLGLEDLSDPGGDRIIFWDDSETKTDWLSVGSTLTLSGTSLGTTLPQAVPETASVSIGLAALDSLALGEWNTCLGYYAGEELEDGSHNVYVGTYAGREQVDGDYNTYVGQGAGTGSGGDSHTGNTGIGRAALYSASTGGYNTALGRNAGWQVTTGASNIFLGYYAGSEQTTNSNLLIIDNQARADIATELSNAIIYGVMAADPADQDLRFNADLTFSNYGAGYLKTDADGVVTADSEIDIWNETNLTASLPIALSAASDISFDIDSLVEDSGAASGDWFIYYDATDEDFYKIDYDDLPGAGTLAPTDAQYVVIALNGDLSAERVLTAGTGLALADGGANGNATLSIDHLGLQDLSDPGADRIVIWDDSESKLDWASCGSGLEIDGTSLILNGILTDLAEDLSYPALTKETIYWDNLTETWKFSGFLATITGTEGIEVDSTSSPAECDVHLDIDALDEDSGVTSGDFFLYYDTVDEVHYKIDFDDMPSGGACEWTSDGGNGIYFDDGGSVIIGTTAASSKMTEGLTIYQGASDDTILALQSSDVAHGITTRADTDTFGWFSKASGPSGGLRVWGASDGNSEGVAIIGITQTGSSTHQTTSYAPVEIWGAEKSGTDGSTLEDNENLCVFSNWGTAVFMVTGDGSLYSPDTGGTCKWILGDNACADVTTGLVIQQRAYSDAIIALKSTSVAHGVTTQAETDTYGVFKKFNSTEGGLQICGFTENEVGVDFLSIYTTDDTNKDGTANAPVQARAIKKDGTGVQNVGADANIFAVRGYIGGSWATVFIVDEDGDVLYDGGPSAFDEYDDLAMVHDVKKVFAGKFNEFIKYNEDDLVRCGVLGAPRSKGGLISHKNMTGLMLGAIEQLSNKVKELSGEVRRLKNGKIERITEGS